MNPLLDYGRHLTLARTLSARYAQGLELARATGIAQTLDLANQLHQQRERENALAARFLPTTGVPK